MSRRRAAATVLALAGAAVAGYLAAVQLDLVGHAWDPIFGDGTDTVIESSVAKLLPFPDALLGVLAYLAEAFLLVLCGSAAARFSPWPGRLLEAEAVAFALAGIGLVALQAFVVHAWCTWCLVSAAISWLLVALTLTGGRSVARPG